MELRTEFLKIYGNFFKWSSIYDYFYHHDSQEIKKRWYFFYSLFSQKHKWNIYYLILNEKAIFWTL